MRCPECHSLMEEGFLSVKEGLHWLRSAETGGMQFAEGVPGTQAIMRPNPLKAWRCRKCELMTFEYGHRHEETLRERARKAETGEPLL